MLVRSLHSSVLKWPHKEAVISSLLLWVEKIVKENKNIVKIGYFGSYARGDWGVGSDLDVIIILKKSATPWSKRSAAWNTNHIPVPVDLLIYTEEEYEKMKNFSPRFYKIMAKEVIWIYP
ncbi:Nucleotidyltransferase domain-containing protein [Thermosyntropha lipolytica DSM 11003]|uniref:Nucleotidyltransferase domain-containing protein n=1 Tax=Thermosyntropha lipolytica DSM 11003 TaxID=1123382 RepID=A0A1M5JGS2_9FIRM|nr:nucleotidyltransferase domain-containing protein [Thermosyntropha lipolytica]SHG39480.1 Nucleotidyltransferase domain-containing protein [Thermosyntropha lipolytica DSM 11003]